MKIRICVFCETRTVEVVCPCCHEYKGLMTFSEYEAYTGESPYESA